MPGIKHFKLSLLIVAFLDGILYITMESVPPLLLAVLPLLYLLLCLLSAKHYRRRLRSLQIDQIDSLSGLDFEYYLFYLFRKNHIRTKITSYTHDFGADLILQYHGRRIVIQAKRWNENVGIQAVQETLGAMSYYKARHGAVITNSFYTKSAIELANASDIVLLNRHDLSDMMTMDANEILNLVQNKKARKNPFFALPSFICPYCGSTLVKRNGRYGSFYGCSSYPECAYTKDIS